MGGEFSVAVNGAEPRETVHAAQQQGKLTLKENDMPKTGACCEGGDCSSCNKHNLTLNHVMVGIEDASPGGLRATLSTGLYSDNPLLSNKPQSAVVTEVNNPGNTVVVPPLQQGGVQENSALRSTLTSSSRPAIIFPAAISPASFTNFALPTPNAPEIVPVIGRVSQMTPIFSVGARYDHHPTAQSGSGVTFIVAPTNGPKSYETPQSVVAERVSGSSNFDRGSKGERGSVRESYKGNPERSVTERGLSDRRVDTSTNSGVSQSNQYTSSATFMSSKVGELVGQKFSAETNPQNITQNLEKKTTLHSEINQTLKGASGALRAQLDMRNESPSSSISFSTLPNGISSQKIPTQFQQVVATFARLENVIAHRGSPANVENAYRLFAAATSQAAAYVTGMKQVNTQVSVIARVFTAPDTSLSLAARIVAANVPQIRDLLIQALRTTSVQVPPDVLSQRRGQVGGEIVRYSSNRSSVGEAVQGGRNTQQNYRSAVQVRSSDLRSDIKSALKTRSTALRERVNSSRFLKRDRSIGARDKRVAEQNRQTKSGAKLQFRKLDEKLQRKNPQHDPKRGRKGDQQEAKSKKIEVQLKGARETLKSLTRGACPCNRYRNRVALPRELDTVWAWEKHFEHGKRIKTAFFLGV